MMLNFAKRTINPDYFVSLSEVSSDNSKNRAQFNLELETTGTTYRESFSDLTVANDRRTEILIQLEGCRQETIEALLERQGMIPGISPDTEAAGDGGNDGTPPKGDAPGKKK